MPVVYRPEPESIFFSEKTGFKKDYYMAQKKRVENTGDFKSDELAVRLGERIKSLRTSKHYSQEKLALLAGINTAYVGQIERGEKNATVRSAAKIAKALELSLSELFEKIDEDLGTRHEKLSIPLKAYYFLSERSPAEQKRIYSIIQDICTFK